MRYVQRKGIKKMLAYLLILALFVGSLPPMSGVLAATFDEYVPDGSIATVGTITHFDELDSRISAQQILSGEGVDAVYFPASIYVTVLLEDLLEDAYVPSDNMPEYAVTPEGDYPAYGNDDAYDDSDVTNENDYVDENDSVNDSLYYEDDSAYILGSIEMRMGIYVSWQAQHFDADVAGAYAFYPIIPAAFYVAATLPSIIVEVLPLEVDGLSFAPLSIWDQLTPANNGGLTPTQFSGRLGEWGQVSYANANFTLPLRSIQAIQQDYNLYVAVTANPGQFGSDWVLYIDNGGFATTYSAGFWRNAASNALGAHVNNRITHRVRQTAPNVFVLEAWVSGTGAGAVWSPVSTGNGFAVATATANVTTNDFLEFRIPLPYLGFNPIPFETSRIVRVGFNNGGGNVLPPTNQSMLIVEAGWDFDLLEEFLAHVQANPGLFVANGNPAGWVNPATNRPWLPRIGTAQGFPTGNAVLSDLYGFRVGNRLHLLIISDTLIVDDWGGMGYWNKIWLNTDYDQGNGRIFGTTAAGGHLFAASGNDILIQGGDIHFQHGNAWDQLYTQLQPPTWNGNEQPNAYPHLVAAARTPRSPSNNLGTHGVNGVDLTPFAMAAVERGAAEGFAAQTAGIVAGEGRFRQVEEVIIDMDYMKILFDSDDRVTSFLGGNFYFGDIIYVGIENERPGFSTIPAVMNPAAPALGERNSAFAAIPHMGARHSFTMQGNSADWANVGRIIRVDGYPGGSFDLRATTCGEVLYTVVEGSGMNTQNVYFISTAATGGFTRNGRPNTHFIVSGDRLYQVTGAANTATPEVVTNATVVGRVRMEYWEDHVMMKLFLDQIGSPNPANIRISWQGKGTINVPDGTGAALYMSLGAGNNFTRFRQDGVFYPREYHGVVVNPLMGGGTAIFGATVAANTTIAYAYMSWRDLEPTQGSPDFANVRVWSSAYPLSTGAVLNTALTNFAAAGVYVNLRFIMDYPTGHGTGDNRWAARGNADIPNWLIQLMRDNPINPRTGQPYHTAVASPLSYMHESASLARGGFSTPEGVWYDSRGSISGGTGLAPRYEHHILIQEHARIVQAIADEIARPGSPWNAVGNMQIGSLGHWGEFHNWPTQNAGAFAPMSISELYVQHYIDAFASNPNVQLAMRYAYPISARHNLGMFHDEHGLPSTFAWASEWRNGTAGRSGEDDSGRTVQQLIDATRNPYFWHYSFSGGEYGDIGGNAVQTAASDASVMAVMAGIRYAHTSNLAPRGPNIGDSLHNNLFTGAAAQTNHMRAKNNSALYNAMGFRFFIESFAVNSGNWDLTGTPLPVLQSGIPVDIEMVVHNQGVAPFYRPWPVEISFMNGNTVAYSIIVDTADVDVRTWLPRYTNTSGVHFSGRNVVNFQIEVPDTLAFGNYDLAIAILDPVLRNYEPALRFAIGGEIGNTRRYRLNPVYVAMPDPVELEIDYDVLILEVADIETLTAVVIPANAVQDVVWSTADGSIATVDSTGVVTAVGLGSVLIMAQSAVDGTVYATTLVHVVSDAVNVTGVELEPAAFDLVVGNTQALVATVLPADATVSDVAWYSSDTSVATVDANGVVTAVGAGVATITVRTLDGNHTATTVVTVPISVTSVELNMINLSLSALGDFATLIPTVFPLNATDRSVVWTSSNTAVATVSQTGVITAAANSGLATITVITNDGGFVATATVTVGVLSTDAELVGLSVTPGTITPAFDPAVFDYATSVPNNATNIVIDAITSCPHATVLITGPHNNLAVGVNVITVVVTAQDGTTQNTFTIVVNRAAPEGGTGPGPGDDNDDNDDNDTGPGTGPGTGSGSGTAPTPPIPRPERPATPTTPGQTVHPVTPVRPDRELVLIDVDAEIAYTLEGDTASVVVTLPEDADGVSMTGEMVGALANAGGSLTLQRGRFAAYIPTAQLVGWGIDSRAQASVIITLLQGNSPISESQRMTLVGHDVLNDMLLGEIVSVQITVDGTPVPQNNDSRALIRITAYVGDLNLTAEQRASFTGLVFDHDTGMYRQLGGRFCEDGTTFAFYSPSTGTHGIAVSNNLVRVYFVIGASTVAVNDRPQVMEAVPVIVAGRTYVPLRFVGEALGASFVWRGQAEPIAISMNGQALELEIGVPLPAGMGTPFITNGRTMVPIRYIAETFGAHVIWEGVTQTVRIYQ